MLAQSSFHPEAPFVSSANFVLNVYQNLRFNRPFEFRLRSYNYLLLLFLYYYIFLLLFK